jgi:CubicO group peptidase (beta-lactamase class C family)
MQAVAAGALAGCVGSALGQSKSRKDSPGKALPVRADERVNRILAPVRDTHHLPALIGGVLIGTRLAAIGAVGIRKIGSTEPFLVTDEVHLGSNTKAMTATVIGMLVEEGKLSWRTTIREVFPEVAAKLHPDYQTVALLQLLTHRAGLPANAFWGLLAGRTTTEQRRSLLTAVMKTAPLSQPGSKYVYSNVGYALAGLMAEQVSGQSWETLLKQRLFEPLGMESAGFGSPGRPGSVEQPWGHRATGDQVKPTQVDNVPALGPAGTVHCSMPDWAKFAALHLAGARGKPKLLKLATFRALQTPPPGFDYACGWVTCERTWAGGRALNHNGSNTAWFATIWLAPARDFAILVAANQGGPVAQTATDEAAVELIRSIDYLARPARRG